MKHPTRRDLLKVAAGVPLIPYFSGAAASVLAQASEFSMPLFFAPRGVASGDPSCSSVVLWVGMAPVRCEQILELKWEMSKDSSFSAITRVGNALSAPWTGGTAQIEVEDLEPGTTYYYRFWEASQKGHTGSESLYPFQSETGRTKTLPSDPNSIKFGFVSCLNFTEGYFGALQALDGCDFVISLGDNIYETGSKSDSARIVRKDNIGNGTAHTLEDFRDKYRLYFTDPHLRKARAERPWFVLWDDHEFFNNYPGRADALFPDKRSGLYASGRRAFLEHNPVGKERRTQNYCSRSLGRLAEFFFLDERSFRPLVPCKDTLSKGCPALNDRERSMLGKSQINWFLEGLKSSEARHKIVANEVMMMPLLITKNSQLKKEGPLSAFQERDNGFFANLDSWDGFPSERSKILDCLSENNVTGVTFCTGDIHTGVVGRVHQDPYDIASPLVAREIVTPSVTSQTLGGLASGALSPLLKGLLKAANPHFDQIDIQNHGCQVVELTLEGLKHWQWSPRDIRKEQTDVFLAHEGTITI